MTHDDAYIDSFNIIIDGMRLDVKKLAVIREGDGMPIMRLDAMDAEGAAWVYELDGNSSSVLRDILLHGDVLEHLVLVPKSNDVSMVVFDFLISIRNIPLRENLLKQVDEIIASQPDLSAEGVKVFRSLFDERVKAFDAAVRPTIQMYEPFSRNWPRY